MHDTTRPAGPRMARMVAAIAFLLAALIAPLAADAPAHASTHGAGEYDAAGHWHGSYLENGAVAYCLDYHLEWDGGLSPTWAGTVTSYGSLAPGELAAIGAAVAALGQTSDPAEARAVADAIWYVTDGITPSGATAGRSQQIIDWMAAWVAAPETGTVSMSIGLDAPGARHGTLTIGSMTAGASVTGTIRLTDGVFADTGSDTRVGEFGPGASFAIRGLPATGSPYRIGASLSGTAAVPGYGAAVPVHSYGAGYQSMAGPSSPAVIPMTGSALAADPSTAVLMTTTAAPSVPAGSGVHDTAVIDDLGAGIDLTGWSIGFELYEFAADGVPVCTPETLVHSSARVEIASAGQFMSEPYLSVRPGWLGWVATLYDPAGAAEIVGVCGDPAETTRVEALLAVTGDASGPVGLTIAGGLALGGAGFAAAAANERRRRR